MPDNPRIEELRRRVQKDPASIAFAQLAEEHRRAGDYDEAIRVSRAGLAMHPGYLSARVTLGRALLETGHFDEAQSELEQVLQAAPDNLAAIRALAEIHQRRDEPGSHPGPEPPPVDLPALPIDDFAFADSDGQFAQALEALDSMTRQLPIPEPDFALSTPAPPAPEADQEQQPSIPELSPDLPAASSFADTDSRALTELEAWLAAILADRQAHTPDSHRS